MIWSPNSLLSDCRTLGKFNTFMDSVFSPIEGLNKIVYTSNLCSHYIIIKAEKALLS